MTQYNKTLKHKHVAMQRAIDNIAPWLSASLSDPELDCCDRYKSACDAIFELDSTAPNITKDNNLCDVFFCLGEN